MENFPKSFQESDFPTKQKKTKKIRLLRQVGPFGFMVHSCMFR